MKKILAIIMAIAMVISVSAMTAMAANEVIPFESWTSVGNGTWGQSADGILAPTDAQEWTMLSYNEALGENYTIEFDVKQPDQNDNIKIGFEVEATHNFTQSGLVLEMHNAGVSRIYNWGINSTDEGAYGGCNNGYGGGKGFSKTTDWIHVKIVRAGSEFSVTVNDGEERAFNFTSSDYNGGHLVLGAVNGRQIQYKNISIQKTTPAPETPETPEPVTGTNTFNGETIAFADWQNAGEGSWKQTEAGILTPDSMGEWLLLRYGKDLGKKFRVELDVKQPDTNHQIVIGFACNEGHNYTQSGLLLEMHNAGVSRIYDWNISANDEGAYGGCNNGFGGGQGFSKTTDWIHVVIERDGDHFVVEFDDGEGVKKFDFTQEGYDGGYLVLSARPSRQIEYKNITITTENDAPAKTGNVGLSAAVAMMAVAAAGVVMMLKKKENI